MKKAVFTDFKMIDEDFGGLKAGEVTLIGSRPSMGKTTMSLQIAMNAARAGKNVLFFTPESSPILMDLRLVSMVSGIPAIKFRQWDLTDEEWEVFKETIRDIKKLPIRFVHTDSFEMIKYGCDDNTNPSVDLILIDYLQLIRNTYDGFNDGSLEQISHEYLKKIKKMSKKHNVPIVVLSQLSRNLERRKDKHPRVEDFRIDGLSDKDYDLAFLLYRDAYYDIEMPHDRAELTGVCPKKKLKETGELKWNCERTVFTAV